MSFPHHHTFTDDIDSQPWQKFIFLSYTTCMPNLMKMKTKFLFLSCQKSWTVRRHTCRHKHRMDTWRLQSDTCTCISFTTFQYICDRSTSDLIFCHASVQLKPSWHIHVWPFCRGTCLGELWLVHFSCKVKEFVPRINNKRKFWTPFQRKY